jgi:hypothetical protein
MHRSRPLRSLALRFAAVLTLACILGLSTWPACADGPSSGCTIYHSDRQHLWNRLHEALFVRVGPDGQEYGRDRLEPLLWLQTRYLAQWPASGRAMALLDEFITVKGEKLIDDPLKRAVMQRDLWLVLNWLEWSDGRFLRTLPVVINRLTLTHNQIKDLPDNYTAAVASGEFADAYDPAQPDKPYLPPDLFDGDGPWVCVGRPDGPVALEHVREDLGNRFTNSAFLVFLRLPEGRTATRDFVQRLQSFSEQVAAGPNDALKPPEFPVGTELALVRRALLIDSSQTPRPSALTESVQLRVYRGESQSFHEFRLSRSLLFAGHAGGLRAIGRDERDFKTGFRAHGYDPFEILRPGEVDLQRRQQSIRENCSTCHRTPGIVSFNSLFNFKGSMTRDGDTSHPVRLAEVSPAEALATGAEWKQHRRDWIALQELFRLTRSRSKDAK